jgi:hypothetical protein
LFDSVGQFRIPLPGISIPLEIQTKLSKKEKWATAIALDGPTALYSSSFMNSLDEFM